MTELVSRYPLSYYATLPSRTNTKRSQSKVTSNRDRTCGFVWSAPRISRRRRYPEWAEVELQWAAQNEANSYPAALALAETASRRGAYDVSIRYIKKFAPGYLTFRWKPRRNDFGRLPFRFHIGRR